MHRGQNDETNAPTHSLLTEKGGRAAEGETTLAFILNIVSNIYS